MPDIPVSSPLGYIGVFSLFFGVLLVLAGLSIFKIEKVTIVPGPKTWGIGIFLVVLGIALLLPDVIASFSQHFTPTPTVAVAEAAPIATVILPTNTLDEKSFDTPGATPMNTPTLGPVNTPTIPPTPGSFVSPTVASLSPRFGPLTFCAKEEFDKQNSCCKVSRQVFTRPLTDVYVSWTYQGVYKGMIFSRKWYRDGELILDRHSEWDGVDWGLDGDSEYTYVENRHGFEAGLYRLDLYINGQLVQQGSFSVQ